MASGIFANQLNRYAYTVKALCLYIVCARRALILNVYSVLCALQSRSCLYNETEY